MIIGEIRVPLDATPAVGIIPTAVRPVVRIFPILTDCRIVDFFWNGPIPWGLLRFGNHDPQSPDGWQLDIEGLPSLVWLPGT